MQNREEFILTAAEVRKHARVDELKKTVEEHGVSTDCFDGDNHLFKFVIITKKYGEKSYELNVIKLLVG